jgi:hypothetical protein
MNISPQQSEEQMQAALQRFNETVNHMIGRILCQYIPAAIVYLMGKVPSSHRAKKDQLVSELRFCLRQQEMPVIDPSTKTAVGTMRVIGVLLNPTKGLPLIIGELHISPKGDGRIEFTSKVNASVHQVPITDRCFYKFLKSVHSVMPEAKELVDLLELGVEGQDMLHQRMDYYEQALNPKKALSSDPEADKPTLASLKGVSEQPLEGRKAWSDAPEPSGQEKPPINEPEANATVPEYGHTEAQRKTIEEIHQTKRFTKSYGTK